MAKKRYSAAEKTAYKSGFFAGRNSVKQKRTSTKRQTAKPRYLGSTYVNGKFYDTNFKKPVEITRDQISELRSSYQRDGERATDKQIVDRFVNHMRVKYGSFDRDGNFLGLLGDK